MLAAMGNLGISILGRFVRFEHFCWASSVHGALRFQLISFSQTVEGNVPLIEIGNQNYSRTRSFPVVYINLC